MRAQTGQPSEPFAVDAAQAYVTGGTRVIGLAGAFTAIAEDMDGVAKNPASVAVRVPYSIDRWEYGFGVSFSVAGWLPETDLLNRGDASTGEGVEQRSALFGSVGATLQYDQFGVGAAADGQQQALTRSEDASAGLEPTDLSGNFGIAHASAAYGLFDGQVVLGAGPRITGLSLGNGGSSSGIVGVAAIGYQVGAIIKPNGQRFRIGAAYKSPLRPTVDATEATENAPYDVEALRIPWELSAGVAYQFGPRHLNTPLVTVSDRTRELREKLERRAQQRARERAAKKRELERSPTAGNEQALERLEEEHEREAEADEKLLEERRDKASAALLRKYMNRPRRYWLVSTDLVVLGPSDQSVSFASLWQPGDDGAARSGERPTLSPRLGVETEIIPRRMKVRGGTYFEPARLEGATGRLHGTLGFDLKLFHWDVFGLIGRFDGWVVSVAADGAREYLNTAFSIGFWH